MNTVKRKILLNPGPVTTTNSVKQAQIVPDICPRENEFGKLMQEISTNLTQLVADDDSYTAVLFAGSGTAAVESILSSVIGDETVLIINSGAYGKRMCEIAAAYGLNYVNFISSPEEAVDLTALEAAIRDSKPSVSHVAVVHNETTTGLLTDLMAIGKLCEQYGADLIVDAMSSFGAIPIQMKRMNIRYLAASSNKNLQGLPGVSFVIAEKNKLISLKTANPRNYYLHLYAQFEHFTETQQMRFTPPVQTLYALHQAIHELLREGISNRYARYAKSWKTLTDGMAKRGMNHLVAEKNHSKIVTSFYVPERMGFDFQEMHDFLYRKGVTVYPGKIDTLRTFRIANIGDITSKDIHVFLAQLDKYLTSIGNKAHLSAESPVIPNSKNKLLKYEVMNNSMEVKPSMPETRMLTDATFKQLLAKYGKIISKPIDGYRGQSVYLISSMGNDGYEIHIENKKYNLQGRQKAFEFLTEQIGSHPYVVQRYVQRASIDERPFDMRVIVQRKKRNPQWVVTGIAVKVAGSGYIVSNIERSGGTILPFEMAIQRSSLNAHTPKDLLKKLERVALRAADKLKKLFPKHRIYGFDIALDTKAHVWIIEANLYPYMTHFEMMEDKTMLHRILRYKEG
nr:2-aminoethylphosphonate--pyruvate transaminase [Gorillibacterium timonense]